MDTAANTGYKAGELDSSADFLAGLVQGRDCIAGQAPAQSPGVLLRLPWILGAWDGQRALADQPVERHLRWRLVTVGFAKLLQEADERLNPGQTFTAVHEPAVSTGAIHG